MPVLTVLFKQQRLVFKEDIAMPLYPSLGKKLSRLCRHCSSFLRSKRRTTFSILFFLFCCFHSFSAIGVSVHKESSRDELPGLPVEYGEVIYHVEGTGSNQLYIIGISHRDPQKSLNNSTTVKTQADVFRIGEWLSANRQLQLLLPEGYFGQSESVPAEASRLAQIAFNHQSATASLQLDNVILYRKLADESCFTNAEMLLMESCKLPVSQVEDQQIYDAVLRGLMNLQGSGTGADTSYSQRHAELEYLQQTRTAVLLQKIPSVIDGQMDNGTIHHRSAMFTIGLNHLQDIIRYLQNDAISIDFPGPEGRQDIRQQARLNLLKQGYGITIIIPRTLADDHKLLQVTKLDRTFQSPGRPADLPLLN